MILTLQNLDRLISKNSVTHTSDLEKQRFSASFQGADYERPVSVEVSVQDGALCFTSPVLEDVSDGKMEQVQAVVELVNQNLAKGQLKSGDPGSQVNFCLRCPVEEGKELSAEELASYLFLVPMTVRYSRDVMDAVLEKGLSPKEAVERMNQQETKPSMSYVLPDPPGVPLPRPRKRRIELPDDDDDLSFDSLPFLDDVDELDAVDSGYLTMEIRDYYDSRNWRYDYDPVANVIRMRIHSCCVDSYQVLTFIRDDERFTTLTAFPIKIPEGKRRQAAEFIARANYGMILGCFEMNPEDGQLQFKDTCLCGDTLMDPKIIERHIDVGFRMCDRYGPALLEMLYGGLSPREAVEKAEADIRPRRQPEEQEVPPRQEPPAPPQSGEEASHTEGFFRKKLRGLLDGLLGGNRNGDRD